MQGEVPATNLLRNLCAIDFHIRQSMDESEVIGTMNFHDPSISNEQVKARFGIATCTLSIGLHNALMPLRYQLSQKHLIVEPIGDQFRETMEKREQELEGRIEGAIAGPKPKIAGKFGGKQKESTTTSGKKHSPQYIVHIDVCGDSEAPAWRIKSTSEAAPIVGIIKEETFGRIVDLSEMTRVSVELSVARDGIILDIQGQNTRRNKALKTLLLKEIQYLIDTYGAVSKQVLRSG